MFPAGVTFRLRCRDCNRQMCTVVSRHRMLFLSRDFVTCHQVAIDTQWLIMVPPHAVKATSNVGEDVWICNHFTFRASGGGGPGAVMRMSEFVRNEFENHVLSLVYVMFLILLTALLSLKAHGIVTNHRESVFIGISAGFRSVLC